MNNAKKYKHKGARTIPLQARSKERVRIILAAALELFREHGMEAVTTNEIAQRAGVPIGSLYHYYPNKDAIIAALTDEYVDNVSKLFANVGKHHMLPYLSWDEILQLMVDDWIGYSRVNGSFTFLYAELANPRLREQNRHTWERFAAVFVGVLKKRCPDLTDRQAFVCYELCLAAVEIGINDAYASIGRTMYHEAVGAVAAYMLRVCGSDAHHANGILG